VEAMVFRPGPDTRNLTPGQKERGTRREVESLWAWFTNKTDRSQTALGGSGGGNTSDSAKKRKQLREGRRGGEIEKKKPSADTEQKSKSKT